MATWPTTASAANTNVTNANLLSRSTSSRRWKHDIRPLPLAQSRAMLLALPSPVVYRGISDKDQRPYLGFLAEDVAPVAPLLALYDGHNQTGKPNYVTYDRMCAILVPVVQDHEARIAALEAR